MFTVVVTFTEFRFVFKLHFHSVQTLENRHLVKTLLADEKTPTMRGT